MSTSSIRHTAEIGQKISENVLQMLTQMANSHAVESGRRGTGFTPPPFGGVFGCKGGFSHDHRLGTDIHSTVSSGVEQSISSFCEIAQGNEG